MRLILRIHFGYSGGDGCDCGEVFFGFCQTLCLRIVYSTKFLQLSQASIKLITHANSFTKISRASHSNLFQWQNTRKYLNEKRTHSM